MKIIIEQNTHINKETRSHLKKCGKINSIKTSTGVLMKSQLSEIIAVSGPLNAGSWA